jgi:predicted esterase
MQRKLRILCLHGYHGSAEILRDQMAPLLDGLDSVAEFVFIDAPSLAVGDYGWWHAINMPGHPKRGDPGVGGNKTYSGWSRTLEAIVAIFERQGPFDGVFGMSQGAALTGLLVGLRSQKGALAFDFAVMVGGFLSADSTLAKLYDESSSYELPSAHILGRSDTIVPIDLSARLAAKFKEPLLLEHGGGHVVASAPEVRQGFRAFIERMYRRPRATV